MLRLSFPSSRPALRKACRNPRCLRTLHERADPTIPEDLSREKKRKRNRIEQRKLNPLPEHILKAVQPPKEAFTSHVFLNIRSKHNPAFLQPEAGVEVPKKTKRRKKTDPDDGPVSVEAGVEISKKKRQKKQAEPEGESEVASEVAATKRGKPGQQLSQPQELQTAESVIVSPQQKAVVEHLLKGYGGVWRKKALGDVRRVNIVGENLCDSILDRIKASLAKHEGCDIIDVNPGPGIWSSKLHDILKPRTHILMEPDTDLYQPLLQPLLDAKDSKYVLVPKPGVIWAHLEKVLSTNNLPFQQPLKANDPRLEQSNNTLLFVANLAYNPKRVFKAFPSLTALVLHQLMSAIRSHALIHQYGTIRMLIWLTDDERMTALPRHVALRKKAAIEAEISCGEIAELASSTRPTGAFRREEDLEIESTLRVLEKMKELGIQTPKGRESVMQNHLNGEGVDGTTLREDDRRGLQYLKELETLEAQYAAGEFEQYSNVARRPQTRKRLGVEFEPTAEYARLLILRYRFKTKINRGETVNEFMARNEEIMDMQKELWGGEGPEIEARREELLQLIQEFQDDVEKIPGRETQVNVMTYLDNQRLLRQDTPALLYDRRRMEPLRVNPSDFFPETELALLDYQPQTLWPVLRKDYPASYDVFEYIISLLFAQPGQSVDAGLKALWPGAHEWIVPECPSLKNPFKGGDIDLTRLKVRCLTHEMLREILESWMRWPWKPNRLDLLGRFTTYGSVENDELMGGDAEGSP